MKWICSQIGAREHYAVPRALHKSGRLSALYTDFWAGRALRRALEMGVVRLKIGALRSLAARWCELPVSAGEHFLLSTAAASSLSFEHRARAIKFWNRTSQDR